MKHFYICCMQLACMCFLLLSYSNVLAQSFQKGLFYNKDLNVEAASKAYNIDAINNDPTRANVIQFKAKPSNFIIQNQRDNEISVAFWACPQNIDKHPGTFFGEHKIFYLRYLSNRRIQFNYFMKKDINTPAVLTENRWQHIGITLNSKGKLSVYFNGDRVVSDSIAPDWWSRKENIRIGTDMYNVSMEGRFDDFMVWDREISPDEMQEVYIKTQMLPPINYGLIAYLPLEKDCKDYSTSKLKVEKVVDIDFNTDSTGRAFATFNGETSFIRLDGIFFDQQKTIAVWIKPNINYYRLDILGNTDFYLHYNSAKGALWYSAPLLFNVKGEKQNIPHKQWVHIALALNQNHKIDYFVNGKKVESYAIGSITNDVSFLEIGHSLYGKNFSGNMSQIAIWDRKLSDEEIRNVYNGKLQAYFSRAENKTSEIIYWVIIGILILAFTFYVFFAKRNTKPEDTNAPKMYPLPRRNAIYLIDTFQAFDKDGKDISMEFSPVLIRLFSCILLYPKVYQTYINSAQISELMWGDDNPSNQKNNRNSNIHRLRSVFKHFDGLELVFTNKEWQIINNKDVFIDIEQESSILKNEAFEIPFRTLRLDKSFYHPQFDDLLRSINDMRLTFIANECDYCFETKKLERLAVLSKLWLSLDSLSDEALKIRINTLLLLNRKQQALRTYTNFCKNYYALLNEEYSVSFENIT